MKMFAILGMVIIIVVVLLSSIGDDVNASTTAWEPVATAIAYQQFQLPGPNNAFVARMERDHPDAFLESSIAQGKLASGRETTSSMAARYDDAINYWDEAWGKRNQVVVAINGDYFNWNSGIPFGGQIQSGWYSKRFNDLGGGSGFIWKLDGTAFIGECVLHRPEDQFVTYSGWTEPLTINAVNVERQANQLVLYTPQYDSNTGTSDAGVEVLVEMVRPTLILPDPSYARGFVRQVNVGHGSTLIPFDHIVLSGTGAQITELLSQLSPGAELHITQEVTTYAEDCQTPLTQSWTKAYAGIGGGFYFLKNGEVRSFEDNPGATYRNPRTAIAYNDDYIFFIVVDGRDPKHSIGMSIEELGIFARDTLSATYGISQDGGGSSTFVINGEVINNSSCNNYCYYTNLPMITRDGSENTTRQILPEIGLENEPIERWVSNGMLMVLTEPLVQSSSFTPNTQVTTTITTELRLGPGTNYAPITTLPMHTQVMILEHMNNLDGVLAKEAYWWKISVLADGNEGWVVETALPNALATDAIPAERNIFSSLREFVQEMFR